MGRIVSGDIPDNTTSLRSSEFHTLGGSPNYTAIATEGLATCDADAVFSNSVVGPSGDPVDRMFVSFSEQCEGVLVLAFGDYEDDADADEDYDEDYDGDGLNPQNAAAYECSEECVDWLINYGVCAVTDLKEVRFVSFCYNVYAEYVVIQSCSEGLQLMHATSRRDVTCGTASTCAT